MNIDTALHTAARKHIAKSAIVKVGDIVTTTWGGWKRPQRVRITHVGAHLVCRYDPALKDWVAGFAMNYVAERLRADGSSKERAGMGIYLHNLITVEGATWNAAPSGIPREQHEEAGFNHAGLSWGTSRDKRRAKP